MAKSKASKTSSTSKASKSSEADTINALKATIAAMQKQKQNDNRAKGSQHCLFFFYLINIPL